MSSRSSSRRRVLQAIASLSGLATSRGLASLGALASGVGHLPAAWAADTDPLPALRAGGLAVLLRHAKTTAGSGDPPGYRLDDCASQRNLDDVGRAQAARVGKWFAEHGIAPSRVRNSPWCRCRDTAKLAFDRFEDWPALGNIFDRELDPAHVVEVQRFVARLKAGEVAVLVSHGVTIAALSGAHPAPAEGVLVRAPRTGKALEVVGRLVVG
jgi:phosphohistidine phosphatase SixA